MKKKLLIASLILVCLCAVFFLSSCDGGNSDDGRPTYTVTFDPKGGTFDGSLTIEVKEGDKIPEPPKPIADGKIFTGWYAGKSRDTKWNFETNTVTADITLTAWYSGGSACKHETMNPIAEKSYDATCETVGKLYTKCAKCGIEKFQNIPKLGHDIKTEVQAVTCATDGYTREYCAREGCDKDSGPKNIIPATGKHEYSNKYITLINPTQFIGGQEARVCNGCGGYLTNSIPSIAEMDNALWKIDIGNYTYTGGKYVDAAFVDIAKTAGIFASSYYTVCTANKAIDNSTSSFWCADTLADGASYTGDTITITFAQKFDVGMVSLNIPYYYSWELGEDCYVSYDLEALIDGEWTYISTISDKNAYASGVSGIVKCEFDTPINTDSFRLTVKHSSRYTPAMIYDITVMAAVNETERVTSNLISSSTYTSSGKYNSWATGTETLTDGSLSTFWNSDYHIKRGTTNEVFAAISFPEPMFVSAVQFIVPANASKKFELYYADDNGEWVKGSTCELVKGKDTSFRFNGELEGSGEVISVNDDNRGRAIFTINIADFTSAVKLVIVNEGIYWESYVYEFAAYTAIEQAIISSPTTPNGIQSYQGCKHNSFKTVETVAPNCTDAGYTIMECYGCGLQAKTDAVDTYGHLWGEYEILSPAKDSEAGTKQSVCQKPDCKAARITSYYNEYEDIKITTYKNNAPAAWAQTFDDGNYIGTYEWLVPKLQHYGWKATAVLSISFCDAYVENWKEYFATGVLDLGSHSYTHGGYYSGVISENSLISDVNNAHYWFMSKFAGQRLLAFATPNGATSVGTSEFVTGIMATARNGGNSTYFYNIIDELKTNGYGQSALVGSIKVDPETGEVTFNQAITNSTGEPVWVSTRRAWGNMNSYISKSDQNEGLYMFVDQSGKYVTDGSLTDYAGVFNTNGTFGIVQTGVKDGKPTYGWSAEWFEGYCVGANNRLAFTEDENGNKIPEGGDSIVVKNLSGTYFTIKKSALDNYATLQNYVYDEATNRLVSKTNISGTYEYIETRDAKGNMTDSYYVWRDSGSYVKRDGKLVYDANDNSGYKIWHTTLGSYEKGINEILSVGGMTVECLHEIGNGGTIWATYSSTNSKFAYLDQTGIWVCSYTELIQYMKEQLNATVETISRSANEVVFNLTDTLDDTMFNYALTIEVDIDDSWTADNITATQNGEAVEFFVENGYAYVNAVPDRGNVTISYNG